MITWSLKIIAESFLVILVLLLISSVGRAIQLEAFGTVSKINYVLLEIPVEGSRVLLLLLLIGNGSIRKGIDSVKNMFSMSNNEFGQALREMLKALKKNHKEILLGVAIFSVMAIVLNYFIALMSKNQYLIVWLKQLPLIAPSFNSVALTLFLKNLTVIPLTFFFEVWLILRLLYKL